MDPCGRQPPAGAYLVTAVNKPKVLLVDDDLSVLDGLGSAIESEGLIRVGPCGRWSPGGRKVLPAPGRHCGARLDDASQKRLGYLRAAQNDQPPPASHRYHGAVRRLFYRGGQGRRPANAEATGHPSVARNNARIARGATREAPLASCRPWTANADNLLNQANAFSLADSRNDDARPIVIKSKRATSGSFGG